MTSALLVVDLQRGLCVGRWAMVDIEDVLERVNVAIAAARRAVAPVVFIQHENDQGLVHGSDDWQLDARLDVQPDDLRVRKTACDAFHRTPLAMLLAERGIARVVVCGAQSEFCVDSTVRGALAHGLPVTLLADAHTTLDNGVLTAAQIAAHHNATLSELRSYGPRVTLAPAAAACAAFEAAATAPPRGARGSSPPATTGAGC